MEQTQIKKTVQTQTQDGTRVVQENTIAANTIDANEFTIAKTSQIIWFFGHVIAVLLALRFIFLLLGARLTGIVLLIYNLTGILVLPFRGIFPSAESGISFFDTSAILAVVIYYLIVILITKLIALFSQDTEK